MDDPVCIRLLAGHHRVSQGQRSAWERSAQRIQFLRGSPTSVHLNHTSVQWPKQKGGSNECHVRLLENLTRNNGNEMIHWDSSSVRCSVNEFMHAAASCVHADCLAAILWPLQANTTSTALRITGCHELLNLTYHDYHDYHYHEIFY